MKPFPWLLAGLVACTTGATWNIMGDGSALDGTAWGIAVGVLLFFTAIYSTDEQPSAVQGGAP